MMLRWIWSVPPPIDVKNAFRDRKLASSPSGWSWPYELGLAADDEALHVGALVEDAATSPACRATGSATTSPARAAPWRAGRSTVDRAQLVDAGDGLAHGRVVGPAHLLRQRPEVDLGAPAGPGAFGSPSGSPSGVLADDHRGALGGRAAARTAGEVAHHGALVGQRRLQHPPPAVERSDEVVGGDAHVVEEDLVEVALARDLA